MSASSYPDLRACVAATLLLACGREDIELARRAPMQMPGAGATAGASSGGTGAGGAPAAEDCSASLPQGLLAPRPPMGWNGYNAFGCAATLNEAKVKDNAQALIQSGMQAAGYEYVNLDLCWELARGADNQRVFDPERLPGGLANLAQFLHERGLRLGVTVTVNDCFATPSAAGFEDVDAAAFATAGVDFVKYAACGGVTPDQDTVSRLQKALDATGRPMVLSLANPPFAEWMPRLTQIWRTGANASPRWDSLVAALDATVPLAAYARPGAFNDPDMLEIGNGELTEGEQRVHLSTWSVLAAPLLAGNDLTTMTEATRTLLTNDEVLALDQDPLGLQGTMVQRTGNVDVLAKPLADCGARGVVLWNRGDETEEVELDPRAVWLGPGNVTIRDLWAHRDLKPGREGLVFAVPPHDALALRVTGQEPPLPQGEVDLSDLSFTYAVNGFGPPELDTSNGEDRAGDGVPMRLRGSAHTRGLGVHAPSLLRYRLGQRCSRFLAEVGIDDETRGFGTARFEVWADGQRLFASGRVTGTSPAKAVDIDVTGRRELRLFVDTGGDDYSHDHADWGSARLICEVLP